MKNTEILVQVKQVASQWLESNIDESSREKIQYLLENDEKELIEAFYRNLEFGTGGMRGIMGVGTNRMNIYTIGMATQGLANYLLKSFPGMEQVKAVIAYDSRNNSRLFAEKTAEVLSANNIKAFLFEELRPTPELSFAVRYLNCQAGVVITASHNPKEYNGYKVYWEDGGQIIHPHDTSIVDEVKRIKSIDEIKFKKNEALIETIGSEIDKAYLDKLQALSLSPEAIERNHDIKIVYTAIHGTGAKLVPEALRKFGFTNVFTIPEQDIPDGNFPTVHSPNPEEPAALNMALEKGKEIDAAVVMGSDPDGDRLGAAIKDQNGALSLLNGNQTGALLTHYLLTRWSEKEKLSGNEYIIKTVVTTELMADMAAKYNVEYYDVLTGFKYFADIIKRNEGTKTYIGGGEESYGYMAGEFVRDKDAVMTCALISEMAAWAKDQEKSLFDILLDIYLEYGFYKEKLISIVRKGMAGAEEIRKMMTNLRETPPQTINNSKVIKIKDYLNSVEKNTLTGATKAITLPKSNVLQFFTEDGSKISARPSGTEPKIKFYFSVKEPLNNKQDYQIVNDRLDQRISDIITSLELQ